MADSKVSIYAELENYTQIEKKLRSLETRPVHVKIHLDGLENLNKQISEQLASVSGKINQFENQISQTLYKNLSQTEIKPKVETSGFSEGASSILDTILKINEGIGKFKSIFENASWLKDTFGFEKNFDQPQTTGCPGFPIFPGRVYHGEGYAIMAA